MIFFLTNVILDVSFGTIWWITKNTTYGVINGIYYIKDNFITNDSDNDNDYNTISNNYIMIENIDEFVDMKNEIIELKKLLKT